MRWHEALTGDARRDFEAFLDEQRTAAVARLVVALPENVVREQATIAAFDAIRFELTRAEREAEAEREYRDRASGTRSGNY